MSKQIVVLLTEKGYAVVSEGEVLEVLDTKEHSALDIRAHYQKTYPSYQILLVSEGVHELVNAVIIAEGFLSDLTKPKSLSPDDFDVPTQEELNNSNQLNIKQLKTSTMKNKVKVQDKARQGAIVTTNVIFGSLHFVLQSAADIVAETEGAIVKKLGRFEESSHQIAERRRAQTKQIQQQALEAPKKLKQLSVEQYNSIMGKNSKHKTVVVS